MGLQDRDYMRQRHPASCTCVLCIGKRGRNLTPEEYAKVKHLLEGTPKTRTYIKYSVLASLVITAGSWILLTLPYPPVVELKQCLLVSLNELFRRLAIAVL
jgi:hypothetical protein